MSEASVNEAATKSLVEKINPVMHALNMRSLNAARILVSMVAGVSAGILDLSGIYGFLFYVLSLCVLIALLMGSKMPLGFKEYFLSLQNIFLSDLSSGIMSFVLFWTVSNNIVHIY